MKALKIKTSNEISVVDVAQPLHLSLNREVSGYIEIVHPRGLLPPFVMVVDEEGLLKKKRPNLIGSVLYETHKHGSPIVGDVVLMREERGPEGLDLAGLSGQDVADLTELCRTILAIAAVGAP